MSNRTPKNSKEAWRRKKQLKQKVGRPTFETTEHEAPEDQSVEAYLRGLNYALRACRDERQKALGMRLYMSFREARVFHLGHDTYITVHQEADRHTTEMAGLDFHMERRVIPQDEDEKYRTTFQREARIQPWPEHLPFPCMFLGYDVGCVLPLETARIRAPSHIHDDLIEVTLLGHLITDTGLAVAFLQGRTHNSIGFWCDEARSPETGWTRGSMDLEPWTIPHMVRLINDNRTFVLESELSGPARKSVEKNRAALDLDSYAHMPRPYYSLRLQSHTIKEKVRKQLGSPPRPKSYKTDVRGHERCRIRRGALPIDPKLAEKLQRRGYKVFASTALDTETFRILSERGVAYKRADEWLAVKASWVDHFVSPADPNLPYVPAVRKIGKVRTRPRTVSGAWTDDPAAR